jgi:transcriptional regulator GlxA family with amidase domain
MTQQVGILIFDEVEVLDFCGPLEVFAVARTSFDHSADSSPLFKVCLIAERKDPIVTRAGMRVLPDYDLSDCPALDILLVPGGFGTRREIENRPLIDWIAERSSKAQITASVCSGSLLLGKAGLLEGKHATTHWLILDWMQQLFPGTTVERGLHFVEDGNLFTSAGVSAGIDLALAIVSKIHGEDTARTTAKYIEYPFPENNARRIAFA